MEYWSEDELEASISAYADMLKKEQQGEWFTKTRIYEDLSDKFGRTPKAYEYRMQNISFVLQGMGLSWINGLKPAKNVGANVEAAITDIIRGKGYFEEQVEQPEADPNAFEKKVSEIIKRGIIEKPTGSIQPKRILNESDQFLRDPKVKAWVLIEADGNCENCRDSAPFIKADGTPYLEVHHLKRLADGGSDTISNAVALCPNCHREFHYGVGSEILVVEIIKRVTRLKKE